MVQLRPHQNTVIDAMQDNCKGQVIVPTGGGKTLCMIKDAQKQFNGCNWDILVKDCDRKTIVIVAPRILLAQQLCGDFVKYLARNPMLQYRILHVHSGDTCYDSTTKSDGIKWWTEQNYRYNRLIFSTYHSLHRLQEADIDVDTIYFDEAHNSVRSDFIGATEYYSIYAKRSYFFTATPRHSTTPMKVGMNDYDIYGDVIAQIPAPKLVEDGYILPPKVLIKEIEVEDDSRHKHEHDCDHIVNTIDDADVDKILICARKTQQIVNIVEHTKFVDELTLRGYSWMYITSRTGAIINGKKVSREKFFDVLNTWGEDPDKRFIVMHHSILSEGINVRGLEAVFFLRNMDYVGISQTIGRVIRKGDIDKKFGLVCVPVYDKVGITTSRKVEAVVDTIFNKGQAAVSVVRK